MTTLIEKSILNERLEKSRSGIYADTSENRRKHRVGQKYGSEKKEEEKPEKTDPNKMSPEQQLEAINKVIAAINEGKLKLPPEEINTLVAKKTMAEEAVKQAKGEKKPEEKEEPKKEESRGEKKTDKASDPIYQVQQKKKEASKKYDSKREEARQKYDKEADEIRSEIDKLYESDHPDAAKKRKELWNTLKEKTNKYDAETSRLKDEYEAEYKKLDEAEDKLYDQRQKEETSEEVKESYTRVKFEDVPNSGKVNLKKYLSDKVKRTADENLGILSKVSTENLKKMEAGLVKEFNSQFGSLSKFRRAEKLYSIMKVKSELENRKQEEIKKYQKYTSSLDDNTLLSIGYDLGEEIRKLSSRGFSTLEQQEEVLKKISELSVKRQINEDEQRKRMDKLN